MEVAVVEHHIELFMEHFNFPEESLGGWTHHIIHHVLIDELKVSPDGHVKVYCAPVVREIVSSKSVDDIREACAHGEEVDELINPHLPLDLSLSIVAANVGDCSLL